MIEITLEQFKASLDDTIKQALEHGDGFCIDTGKGKLVLIEEPEWKILRDGMELLLKKG